jgi:hypothetical protein
MPKRRTQHKKKGGKRKTASRRRMNGGDDGAVVRTIEDLDRILQKYVNKPDCLVTFRNEGMSGSMSAKGARQLLERSSNQELITVVHCGALKYPVTKRGQM